MKAAFDIQPGKANSSDLHLLVEAGSYGISLVWYIKDRFTVEGLSVYNFKNGDDAVQIQSFIDSLKNLPVVSSTTICYDYRESILVPEKFNSSVNEKALALMYGEDTGAVVNIDLVTSSEIYNHYRVSKSIKNTLTQRFRPVNIFHSTSLQLEALSGTSDILYCIIFHNVLKVILIRNGKLQIVQQFLYSSPEDAVYYLLNVCQQHNTNPAEITVRLSGMVDQQSALFTEIYAYFLTIEFEKVNEGVYPSASLKELPVHFFSHLTALVSCVL